MRSLSVNSIYMIDIRFLLDDVSIHTKILLVKFEYI